mgnify:CR=1 FL=1
MEKILWALNKMPKSEDKCLPVMSIENIKQAREFHKSFPQSRNVMEAVSNVTVPTAGRYG